ncbi:hypothetical protein [Streptomyces qinglanensis]|uniref:hypothetical protein n=1 Tax=Streptomyces qinglanensis TaxID=943816 RepID=UPI000941CC63|nr:hypothetical protein [Streptomyces qinglanensis]
MKVQAVARTGAALPSDALSERWNIAESTEFAITPGCEYIVFGITCVSGLFWYYILDDRNLGYPVWHPCALFEVKDGTIPSWWIANYFPHYLNERSGVSIISFPEWAADALFYEKLFDGDSAALAAFNVEVERQSSI